MAIASFSLSRVVAGFPTCHGSMPGGFALTDTTLSQCDGDVPWVRTTPVDRLARALGVLIAHCPNAVTRLTHGTSVSHSALCGVMDNRHAPQRFRLRRLTSTLRLDRRRGSTLLLRCGRHNHNPSPELHTRLRRLLRISFQIRSFARHRNVVSGRTTDRLHYDRRCVRNDHHSPYLPAEG